MLQQPERVGDMIDLSYKVASGLPYLFAASALSLLLTRLCITILPWFKLVDIPRGRHQHDRVVPRGGGIAIILSFVFVIALWLFTTVDRSLSWYEIPLLRHFAIPTAAIAVLGLCDDRFELRSIVKLAGQILIALYFYFSGAGIDSLLGVNLPVYIALPLTVCWVVGIINAFNLIDGLDGVAAGLASISSFSMAVWLLISEESMGSVVCMLVFCGSCLGFLKYNFAPARIFMGDTGSMFIGMFFAYFSMAESAKAMTITSFLVPVLAMGIPMFDAFLAILRRFFRKYIKKEPGVGIMTGDHDHLHHRLQEQLKNQKKTACYLYGLAILLVVGAMSAALLSDLLRSLSFAVLLGIIFVVVRCATIEFYDAASLISEGVRIPRRSFLLTALHPVVDVILLFVAYLLTSKLFQRNIMISPYTLKQAMCYIAPYPVILGLSGIYRTYWLRAGITRYYKLLLLLLLASGVVLALALGFILLEFGRDRDQISLMREFFSTYVLLGGALIFAERFLLHYIESFGFKKLAVTVTESKKQLARTVIYGGGLYCRMFLISHNCTNSAPPVRDIIGIIDDNPSLRGLNVYGLDVLGTSRDLARLREEYHFDEIVIALKNISPRMRNKLDAFGREFHIRILEFHCALTLPDSGKQAEKSEKTAQKAGERNDLRNAGALPEKSGEEPGTPDSENILSKE